MPISDNKRIAKNTLMLYFRMLLTIIVSLYTSRITLNVLGVEDFGINNVVAGVVAMIAIINSSLSGATSRFMIYELGKQDYVQLKKVFNATLASHIGLAMIVFVFAETIGLWIVTHKLVIPEERMSAAMWAYQFSVFSTMVTLTQVPYNALIIAHEKMNIYAYVSLLGVALKLLSVYLLKIGGFDKLKLYSTLGFLVTLFIAMIYRVYCTRKYQESHISFQWDKPLYKKLFAFSAWELYGTFAGVIVAQGLNMLLNMFFGPAVNAARGIAITVQGHVMNFGKNFLLATKPQIVKLYADNKITQMMNLVFSAGKYSFFLTFFLSLPLLLEAPFVFKVWLKTVPDYTVIFCRLVLIRNLLVSLHGPIGTSFHAVGKLKLPSLIGGTLFYLTLLLSYFALKLGGPPQVVFVVQVFVTFIVQIVEMFLLKRFIKYSLIEYLIKVIAPVCAVSLISAVLPLTLNLLLEQGFIRFLVVGFTCVLSVSSSVYFIGLEKGTKKAVNKKIIVTIRKIRRAG